MDAIPFLEINLLHMKNEYINELKRFQKSSFDIKGILSKASDLKYTAMIKKEIIAQFTNPSDQLIRLLLKKDIFNGIKTQTVLDKFRIIIKASFNEYVSDLIHDKCQNAIISDATGTNSNKTPQNKEPRLTKSELALLEYIRKLIGTNEDITFHKTSRYISMQIGENSRKWICRIYTRQNNKLLVLHKFETTKYECEYYFYEPELLEQIKDIITDVFLHCKSI